MEKRYKTILLIPLLVWLFTGCEKGNDYFKDYHSTPTVHDGTIYSYLSEQAGVYDSLLIVLDRVPTLRTKLEDVDASMSFFAVSNRSFELAVDALNTTRALTGRAPLYLEDVGLKDLDSLINRYAFDQEYDTERLSPFIDGQVVQSTANQYKMHIQYRVLNASGFIKGGQQQLVLSDTNNSIFQRYWQSVNTVAVNIKTRNGVIHVLSGGHDFGFGKFTSIYSTQ